VIILAWVYYAAQILFWCRIYSGLCQKYGSQIVPARNAVPLTSEARAEQGIKPNENKQRRQSSGNKPASPNIISRLFRRFTQQKLKKKIKIVDEKSVVPSPVQILKRWTASWNGRMVLTGATIPLLLTIS